jgi:uncharacterized protein YcnI
MKKIIAIFTSIIGILTIAVAPAFAHVIVYPSQVGEAALQDFTVSVPNEKDNPVVSVRLLIPKGLMYVAPDATAGWTITTKSHGSGDNAVVTEIDWTNGSIPVGQRAELIFQAQVPPTPTTLPWKAYQTYSDGTVVSWDINPEKMKGLSDAQQDKLADEENKGEYSTTQVINDLTGVATAANNANAIASIQNEMQWLVALSGVALIVSVAAIAAALRKKK